MTACGEGEPTAEALDAGADVHVPVAVDVGAPPDASPPVDAGVVDDAGAAAPDAGPSFTALFGPETALEPAVFEDTASALVTRFADRGRDRHAREDQFQSYEHYLPLYWEHRTAQVEIEDPIGKGGDTIRFRVRTEWPLQERQAELRLFYRGVNTVAEYFDNRPMTPVARAEYVHEVSLNAREGRPLQVGDRMEFELSQFLAAPPRGRTNYYGTTYLYVVGEGIQPWIGRGEDRDSFPLPSAARLGGDLTIHENHSDEPVFAFSQMATNLAPQHGQPFVRGRRLIHTDFVTGAHDESDDNPVWREQVGKAGPAYIDTSCDGCHHRNGRALPPALGAALEGYVIKVGEVDGAPHPRLGAVLQTRGASPEATARLARWSEADGLRRPVYDFGGEALEHVSARISPALVGLGLLEAVPEATLAELADPEDADGDGISGRLQIVSDPSGVARVGRFGWKAAHATVRSQTAGALRTDMGVLTSDFPTPDCGAEQTDCGPSGAELSDAQLEELVAYVALLGVPPQRGFDDPRVQAGAAAFGALDCEGCHTATLQTSSFAPHAELRGQTIHPFTDLLLHDMGPGLADALPEGRASGAEWRTAPLWGLGRTAGVSGGEAYLHDGRARTLREAILWHGGEGATSRDAFTDAPTTQQEELLVFLRSL